MIGAVFQRSSYVFPDPLPFHRVGHGGLRPPRRRAGAGARVLRRRRSRSRSRSARPGSSSTRGYGRALRAVADDREGARVVGVPVELLVTLAFALVGALAMLAAVAAAPGEAVNANTGTLLGLKGLVAALAVRFGPPLWAFAAGLVLGVVESAIANVHLGGWQLGPSYREVLPLAVRAAADLAAALARGARGARVSVLEQTAVELRRAAGEARAALERDGLARARRARPSRP